VLGELFDRITAIKYDPLVEVDKRDLWTTSGPNVPLCIGKSYFVPAIKTDASFSVARLVGTLSATVIYDVLLADLHSSAEGEHASRLSQCCCSPSDLRLQLGSREVVAGSIF
jgi:hypothetical protein